MAEKTAVTEKRRITGHQSLPVPGETVGRRQGPDPRETVKITSLMRTTLGRPEIAIGIIDGPVASHPDFQKATFKTVSLSRTSECAAVESPACSHGTFIAGMLGAGRDSLASAICPGCTMLVRPIFCDQPLPEKNRPHVAPLELAAALAETVKAGARVINLSMGLSTMPLREERELAESFEYAFRSGVLLVAAAGNQGRIGHIPLFGHPWVIPVAASDLSGNPDSASNFGPSLGKRGLMAPGIAIPGISPAGYTTMSGTSVAAPFVTGAAALLWSLFPRASASEIRRAILRPGKSRRSIIPPLLDGEASWRALRPYH